MTASDSAKLDACDQSCLRKICGVHWSQHVTNAEIRRRTGQLPVSKLIAKRRLELFGHIARSDPASDIRRAVAATASRDWRRPRGSLEGHATRGDRPFRLMWPRSTLACTPHGAGRRTELSGELQLFVPRYRSVVGGWKEGRFTLRLFSTSQLILMMTNTG